LWLFGKQWFCLGAKDEASYKQILGSTVGLAVSDEVVEYPKSFLAQLFMRMSPQGARFYGSTNPGNPYCYLKADVIDNEAFAKDLEVIHFTLDDNPNIDARTKASIVASQTGVFKLRYINGLWVVAEGSIFRDSWNENLNTCTNKTEPIQLKNAGGFVDRWYSIDPGVDHVQAHLEFYDDGDVIWVTREQRWDSRIQLRQKTDGQYCDDLEEFMGGRGYQVILPPEAASLRAELNLRGFWVTEADNSVIKGIHTVSTLLSRRKLRINKDECPELAKRVPTYAWDAAAAKRGEEQPLKVEDDDCDALRYGVHGKIPAWRVSGG
jgi:PBSX family phage terminase large subunit